MLHCYTSGHAHSLAVCTAFAAGGGFPLLRLPAKLQLGAMFTYGNLRGLKPVLDQAILDGRDWYYADNGYFRPGHYDGYYRVTKNAYQHDGAGSATPARWERLGKPLLPWKKGGSFVMVCPPGDAYARLRNFDNARWLKETLTALQANTDRRIEVRVKPAKGKPDAPLWAGLKDCHALVTHSSNSAVEALLFGVPVFCTAHCAASRMACNDIAGIETPLYRDGREQWAWNLAAAQWTLDEMKAGTAKSELGL